MTSRRSIEDEALEVAQSKGVATPKLQSTKCGRVNDSYIDDDELVEVTPKSLRLRKRYLDPNERKRMEKKKAAVYPLAL